MSKTIKLAASLIILVTGLVIYLHSVTLPNIARTNALSAMKSAGFSTITLPEPRLYPGSLLYEDINLDEDGISTIKAMRISYSIPGLLFKKRFKSIEIGQAELIGEYDSGKNILNLSGWEIPPLFTFADDIPVNSISIINSKISVLTKKIGGIYFDISLEGQRKKNSFEFLSQIESAQQYFSFRANAKGIVTPERANAEIEIENGKFIFPEISSKTTRLNGWIRLALSQGYEFKILSELQAGGLTLNGFPWQNASASAEMDANALNVFVGAKSIGQDGLELSLNYQDLIGSEPALSGSLYMDKMSSLLDYLEKTQGYDTSGLKNMPDLDDLGALFTVDQKDKNTAVEYEIQKSGTPSGIGGTMIITPSGDFEGKLRSDPIFLTELETLFTSDSKTLFTGGSASFSGQFSKTKDTLSADLKMNITDGALDSKTIPLSKITGVLQLQKDGSFSTSKDAPLSCALPLKASQNCTARIKSGKNGLEISNLTNQVFDGRIEIENFKIFGDNAKTVVKIHDVDIEKLLKSVGIPGLSGFGKLTGEIPLVRADNTLLLNGTVLKNQDKGYISYIGQDLPDFIKGSDLEKETIKIALENFRYDYFELRLSGPLEDTEIKMISQGYNPTLPGKESMLLNFSTKSSWPYILGKITD